MPTQVLSIGPPTLMLANVAYALPAVEVVIYTDAASPTITTSTTAAFTANSAITLTAGASAVTGGFIKATADTLVILKRD